MANRAYSIETYSLIFNMDLEFACLWGNLILVRLRMIFKNKKRLQGPGFEPGFLRPQRNVLTTRQSKPLSYTRNSTINLNF